MQGGTTRTNILQHDGRYYKTMKHGGHTRVSAFVFSSPKTTAIMENPERCSLFRRPFVAAFLISRTSRLASPLRIGLMGLSRERCRSSASLSLDLFTR